jgi:hypothetical protein
VAQRHQAIIRTGTGDAPSPQPFDNPLGARSVFTLAAAFITSCPAGSALKLQAFPAIKVVDNQKVSPGTEINLLQQSQATGATNCAFTAGGVTGGTMFVQLNNGKCTVPPMLMGEVYMSLTKTAGPLTDDAVVAG